MEKWDMMQLGFFICIGVAVLLFIVSIILFVKFDIRSILAARSVRKNAAADQMEDMAQAQAPAAPDQGALWQRPLAQPEDGAERTVVLRTADPGGMEMTAVLPVIKEQKGSKDSFTIVKKVVSTDSPETIV